jgi:hypothetical protein
VSLDWLMFKLAIQRSFSLLEGLKCSAETTSAELNDARSEHSNQVFNSERRVVYVSVGQLLPSSGDVHRKGARLFVHGSEVRRRRTPWEQTRGTSSDIIQDQ